MGRRLPRNQRTKKYRRKYISKTKLDAVVDATVEKRLAEMFPRGAVSPTQQHTPIITHQPRASHFILYWLQANMDGVKTRVAKGQIIQFIDGSRMIHGVILPFGMMRV